MTVGVLALQGDFREHLAMLDKIGVDGVEVRVPEQLDAIDALVIPGGESTTIGRLASIYGLIEPIRRRSCAGMPVLGTCAGMIFLASSTAQGDQPQPVCCPPLDPVRQKCDPHMSVIEEGVGKAQIRDGDQEIP